MRVSDADVEQEYRRRNEKVKLDLAIFNASDFRAGHSADRRRTRRRIHEEQGRATGCQKNAACVTSRSTSPPSAPKVAVTAAGDRRALSRERRRRYVHARAGARQPHPVCDRGQGRGGGAEDGRRRARTRQGGRRLRRPRQTVLRGRTAARIAGGDLDFFAEGRHGARVRRRPPGRSSRGRRATW